MSTSTGPAPFRHISDTARFVAYLRALESERSDALFEDRHARRLAALDSAGEIAFRRLTRRSRFNAATMAVRTVVIDGILQRLIHAGAIDTVLNLAAGLDTRPFRMDLPTALRWIEADLPGILDHKETVLSGERPRCQRRVVRVDLANDEARRRLLAEVAAESRNTLVLTEGLLMYLRPESVAALARDLHAHEAFRYWVSDILSPAELRWIKRKWGEQMRAANSEMFFASDDPRGLFGRLGWRLAEYHSHARIAPRLRRAPLGVRLHGWASRVFPDAGRSYGFVLLERSGD